MTRDDEELEFSVGIASAVINFVESPTCGYGLDCVTVATVSEAKFSPLFSLT